MSLANTSTFDGVPVFLYRFTRGLVNWFYTGAQYSVTHENVTYLPAPITASNFIFGSDLYKGDLKITFPRDNEFAAGYLGVTPEIVTVVTVWRGHMTENGITNVEMEWKGRVVSGRADQEEITIQCEPISTSMQRPGLRARYERTCRHTLYGSGCRVNEETHKLDVTVSSVVDSLTYDMPQLAGKADGFYTAGFIKTQNGDMRFITNQVGTRITVVRPISLAAGESAVIYPGCDHLLATCKTKFNNLDNFGGWPFLPLKNPMGGSSIV